MGLSLFVLEGKMYQEKDEFQTFLERVEIKLKLVHCREDLYRYSLKYVRTDTPLHVVIGNVLDEIDAALARPAWPENPPRRFKILGEEETPEVKSNREKFIDWFQKYREGKINLGTVSLEVRELFLQYERGDVVTDAEIDAALDPPIDPIPASLSAEDIVSYRKWFVSEFGGDEDKRGGNPWRGIVKTPPVRNL